MGPSPLQALWHDFPEGADAALIISPVNRRYYTGMPSSEGALLVTRTDAALLMDSRYIERARQLARDCEVILRDRLYEQLGALLKKQGVKTLAVETERMTVAEFQRFQKELPDVVLLDTRALDDLICAQRAIKTSDEMRCIRAAQAVTDQSFAELLNFIHPGVTERAVSQELSRLMQRFGGEGEAFDIIAVSGKNSSMPHGVPSDKPLAPGDFLTLDFGAKRDGYCSDMTRTVAIGHATDEMRRVYDTVLAAQQAGFAAIRAGVPCGEVDKAARRVIEAESDFRGCFGHSLGHSLGLEIHEDPRFSPASEATAQAGNVMSVEPGIYLEGRFGVRIEDIVLVSEAGYENLTHSPKELLTL